MSPHKKQQSFYQSILAHSCKWRVTVSFPHTQLAMGSAINGAFLFQN